MTVADSNPITLTDGTIIGHVQPWDDDPHTFDGWVETESGTDWLVINGANRSWVLYEVCRIYQSTVNLETIEERKALLNCEDGALEKQNDRLRRGREVSRIMVEAVAQHYRTNGKD